MKKAGVASPLAGRLPRDRVAPRPGGSPLRRSARTSAHRARLAPRVLSLVGRGGSGGVGEKRVVIVPELPLVVGAPRRFGRLTRLRVEPIDWGIPVRVSNLPGIPLENLRERRLGSLAEGVMEVGEFHDGHGCLGRTADRRTVDRNSRAEDRGRLETNPNRRLHAEQFHEERPPSGRLLPLQERLDVLADGSLVSGPAVLLAW